MTLTRDAFAKGMHLLHVTYNVASTDLDHALERTEVYYQIVKGLTDEEWERGVLRTMQTERYVAKGELPLPAIIIAAAGRGPKATETKLRTEAGRAFDRIERLARHDASKLTRATWWDARDVGAALGQAAMEAFVAAGGSHAWENLNDRSETFVRKSFGDAYVQYVHDGLERAGTRALPQGQAAAVERKMLPSGNATIPPVPLTADPGKTLPPEELRDLLAKVGGVLRPMERGVRREPTGPITMDQEAYERRIEELAEQAKGGAK